MGYTGSDDGADASPGPRDTDRQTGGEAGADGLGESARRLYEDGEAVARSTLRALDALQSLAGHEAALARAALPRALMFAGIAAALGFSAWLYLMALLVVWLQPWLGWPGALALAVVVSLLGAGTCAWRGLALLRLTRFEATRRQLGKLKRVFRPAGAPEDGTPPASGGTEGATAERAR